MKEKQQLPKTALGAEQAENKPLRLTKEQFKKAILDDLTSALGFLNYARNTPLIIDNMADHAFNMQKNVENAKRAAKTPQ